MRYKNALGSMLLVVAATCVLHGAAEAQQPPKTRAQMLDAAQRIMQSARFATLVTLDSTGQPQARIVDPFTPDSAMVIWIGTNPRTRKVADIKRDPRVALTWFDAAAVGYVTLLGTAQVVDSTPEKQARFKPEWSAFYPDRERDYTLIRVTPHRLEVISERDGVGAVDSLSWRPPVIKF